MVLNKNGKNARCKKIYYIQINQKLEYRLF